MSRLHFANVFFVLLLIVGSTTMLQAQTQCPCPTTTAQCPCPTTTAQCPCPTTTAQCPCPTPVPSTHGAWEAYLFGGATTHGNNLFKDTFVANGQTFEDRLRRPSAATFGGKVGAFVTDNFSIDGNLSWYNHLFGLSNSSNIFVFRPVTNTIAGIANATDNEIKTRALLWEASFNYNFAPHRLRASWTPYLVAGAGGVTARIKNADQVFITGGGFIQNPLFQNAGSTVPQFIPNPAPVRILENNDTFFTFSYGGGFKALRLAGPLGFRFDVRGRTLPNFFGKSTTWAEFTGGLAFAWGER